MRGGMPWASERRISGAGGKARGDRLLHVRPRRQVLQEVAGEHDIDGRRFHRPGLHAVVEQQRHVPPGDAPRRRVQLDGILAGADDVVDELAIAAAEVENGRPGVDEALEEMLDEDCPDPVAVLERSLEAVAIEVLQVPLLIRERPCSERSPPGSGISPARRRGR